jgi:soluble lytic murein transglycosylase-like protein
MKWAGVLVFAFVVPLLSQSAEALRWANHWADAYRVERELVHAVIEAESGWNPRAQSRAGAAGLMQLMPDTAAAFGVASRFDVSENIRGGVAYLAWLTRECHGDRRLILASYNAGHARVLKHGLNYRSTEVFNYVSRVAYLYRRNRYEVLIANDRRDRP